MLMASQGRQGCGGLLARLGQRGHVMSAGRGPCVSPGPFWRPPPVVEGPLPQFLISHFLPTTR